MIILYCDEGYKRNTRDIFCTGIFGAGKGVSESLIPEGEGCRVDACGLTRCKRGMEQPARAHIMLVYRGSDVQLSKDEEKWESEGNQGSGMRVQSQPVLRANQTFSP